MNYNNYYGHPPYSNRQNNGYNSGYQQVPPNNGFWGNSGYSRNFPNFGNQLNFSNYGEYMPQNYNSRNYRDGHNSYNDFSRDDMMRNSNWQQSPNMYHNGPSTSSWQKGNSYQNTNNFDRRGYENDMYSKRSYDEMTTGNTLNDKIAMDQRRLHQEILLQKAELKKSIEEKKRQKMEAKIVKMEAKKVKMEQKEIKKEEKKALQDGLAQPIELDKATRMMNLMGWKGGALGAKSDGITAPIEVHVRPRQLGLGFKEKVKDDFQEQTHNSNISTLSKQCIRLKRMPVLPKILRKGMKKQNNMNRSKKTQKKIDIKIEYVHRILDFVLDKTAMELVFTSSLTKKNRKYIHNIVEFLRTGLNCNSLNEEEMALVNEIQENNSFILTTLSEDVNCKRELHVYKHAKDHVFLITKDDLEVADEDDDDDEVQIIENDEEVIVVVDDDDDDDEVKEVKIEKDVKTEIKNELNVTENLNATETNKTVDNLNDIKLKLANATANLENMKANLESTPDKSNLVDTNTKLESLKKSFEDIGVNLKESQNNSSVNTELNAIKNKLDETRNNLAAMKASLELKSDDRNNLVIKDAKSKLDDMRNNLDIILKNLATIITNSKDNAINIAKEITKLTSEELNIKLTTYFEDFIVDPKYSEMSFVGNFNDNQKKAIEYLYESVRKYYDFVFGENKMSDGIRWDASLLADKDFSLVIVDDDYIIYKIPRENFEEHNEETRNVEKEASTTAIQVVTRNIDYQTTANTIQKEVVTPVIETEIKKEDNLPTTEIEVKKEVNEPTITIDIEANTPTADTEIQKVVNVPSNSAEIKKDNSATTSNVKQKVNVKSDLLKAKRLPNSVNANRNNIATTTSNKRNLADIMKKMELRENRQVHRGKKQTIEQKDIEYKQSVRSASLWKLCHFLTDRSSDLMVMPYYRSKQEMFFLNDIKKMLKGTKELTLTDEAELKMYQLMVESPFVLKDTKCSKPTEREAKPNIFLVRKHELHSLTSIFREFVEHPKFTEMVLIGDFDTRERQLILNFYEDIQKLIYQLPGLYRWDTQLLFNKGFNIIIDEELQSISKRLC